MSITKKLAKIQQALKAPKGQENKFGKYSYRSAEDILEAVKPLLGDCVLSLSDEVVMLGEGEHARFYIKATSTLTEDGESFSVSALAREADEQKGMAASQLTGSTSSYARKYSLNGLFAIDDTKDADATNDHGKKAPQRDTKKETPKKETPKKEVKKKSFSRSAKKEDTKKEEPKKETKVNDEDDW